MPVADPTREAPLAQAYNASTILFAHGLSTNPLFSVESLAKLAARRALVPNGLYCSHGDVRLQDSWASGMCRPAAINEMIDTISDGSSLIIIKGVELDAAYAAPIRTLMSSLVTECGPAMVNDIIRGRATVFLASPYRVTSYHIDADTNFLFQLHGSKDFYVYPDARGHLPDNELESYFSGDVSAAKHRPKYEKEARHYLLDSNSAVHVPSLFPHWAKNRASVSVALSINFDLQSIQRIASLYRLNGRLRRFGFSPQPPASDPSVDAIKSTLVKAGRLMRRFILRDRPRSPMNGRDNILVPP